MVQTFLDKRSKYTLKLGLPFYLYVKRRSNGIFYVRTKDGVSKSTGTRSVESAYQFALIWVEQQTGRPVRITSSIQPAPRDRTDTRYTLRRILLEYFSPQSEFSRYDILHGKKIGARCRIMARNECRVLAELLDDVDRFEHLTRPRIIQLQEQLMARGMSGKTANAYISKLRKISNQLLDRGIIKQNLFLGIRPLAHEKQIRGCYPIKKLGGIFAAVETLSIYEKLAYAAITTGARRAELLAINPKKDIRRAEGESFYLLHIRGTKTENADRIIPIGRKTKLILQELRQKRRKLGRAWDSAELRKAVDIVGERIGFTPQMIAEKRIVFHSYRKCYKTILTAANLNQTIIETLIGHSTNNQATNNVERIYFVAESADLTEVYRQVVASFDFLG